MAKYTIRPTGSLELIEKGMAKVFQEDENGKRIEVGDYKHSLLPGAGKTHRVFWNDKKRVFNIQIPDKVLQDCVDKMKLTDPVTKTLIRTADIHNEYDPFFRHQDLMLDIPNGGMSLDDETTLGLFWLYALKSEPKRFNIDNETDNPIVKKVQEFKVTTAGHSEEEASQSLREGKRATQIFWANSTNYEWLMETCRCLDIKVGKGADIGMMSDAIYLKITTEKDFKTADGQRNIDKFFLVNDMPQDDKGLRAKITEAVGLGIITKEGRSLMFEEERLGTTPDKAYEYLRRPENTEAKGNLLARIREKTGA